MINHDKTKDEIEAQQILSEKQKLKIKSIVNQKNSKEILVKHLGITTNNKDLLEKLFHKKAQVPALLKVYNSFSIRNFLKDRGFKYNSKDKSWSIKITSNEEMRNVKKLKNDVFFTLLF